MARTMPGTNFGAPINAWGPGASVQAASVRAATNSVG